MKNPILHYRIFFIMEEDFLNKIKVEVSKETGIDLQIINDVSDSYFTSIKNFITNNFVGVMKLDYLLKIVHKDSEKKR